MLRLPELIIILLIVLVVFGAGRLPQIGDALGRSIRNFKKSVSGANEIDVTPNRAEPPAIASKSAEPAHNAATPAAPPADTTPRG